jgi:FtsZ-binding cell division protein ZapB
MVSLEQVRQLETKIAKAIDYVSRLTAENTRLKGELDSANKRVETLEGTILRFKEDQGRIEEGIVAALDRLNQFEDAIGRSLSSVQAVVAGASERTADLPIDRPAVPPEPAPEPAAPPASPSGAAAPASAPAASAIPSFMADDVDDVFGGAGEDSGGDEPPLDDGAGELDIF